MQFQVGTKYRNRMFEFEVLQVGEDKLRVRTSEGDTRELSVPIQTRIQENMEWEALQKRPVPLERALRDRIVYESWCWRCSSHISSLELSRCNGCGWYVCRQCTACGCGYRLRWARARVDFVS